MGLLNVASGDSVSRGLYYYRNNKVKNLTKISEEEYVGKVAGSDKETYDVIMNAKNPRKSKCDCPHANGKRIICKHIVAVYFSAFPSEEKVFLDEVEEAQKAYENYERELYKKMENRINSMTKKELQEALIEVLRMSPEWVYDRFIRNHVGF